MGIFFIYTVKSSLCLAVFYLFYKLLLSRETFHRFNRFALLGLLVLSAVLPDVCRLHIRLLSSPVPTRSWFLLWFCAQLSLEAWAMQRP